MAEDSLAILPSSMGRQPPGSQKKKPDPSKFIPAQRGMLLLSDPKEEESPYTFSDSAAYVRNKKAEEQAKRAAELEGKDETRGFLRSVEELAKKQKWEEAYHILERRTAVPSGLFLVTRSVLRWKFGKYCNALRDAEEALAKYSSSAKAGPLAAAFSSFVRICLGSEARDRGSCSREMRELVEAWEQAEQTALGRHALGQGLFHPRQAERLAEPAEVIEGMEASDGSYVAATGVRIGYVFLKNKRDANAPIIVHFHGNLEVAADYRAAALAQRYCDLPVHLLVVDYRGYGWSNDQPSLATLMRDAEPLAEKLPEIIIQHGMLWPYAGGLILSGRSLGAQVAVHLAALYPNLFRGLALDSAVATSATGDRLGRAPERAAALERWRKELEAANLEVLQPLDSDLWCLSAHEKIRAYEGQVLVLHGLADELVPFEGSEGLHAAAGTQRKELVLVEGASHNDIGRFDAYWSALRRFSLKVQLDNSLPSVGPAVVHCCAVCAEKAISKCGRCQKVWYCGRAHQAEHWKTHKMSCGGSPPEPKEKAVPEGDACLVAFLAAEIIDDQEAAAFASCVSSIGEQEEPLQALCVSWHAASQPLSELVNRRLEEFRAGHPSQVVVATEAQTALPLFEHVRVLSGTLPQEVPQHAWVKVLDVRELWSPRHAALLLPALQRAAPDQRAVAVGCPRHARGKGGPHGTGGTADGAMPLASGAAEVDGLLEAGAAELVGERPRVRLGDLAVRVKVLQAFVDSAPPQVLAHPLCAYRFCYKLANTFGKKVQVFNPPEGEWMCWAPTPSGEEEEQEEQGGSVPAAGSSWGRAVAPTDADRRRGRQLSEGIREAFAQAAPGAADEGAGAAAPGAPPPPGRLAAEGPASSAMVALRRRIERRLILSAGEELSARDLRATAMDQMHAFLEEVGLDKVIGVQRWARETADEISREAVQEFAVKVISAQQ